MKVGNLVQLVPHVPHAYKRGRFLGKTIGVITKVDKENPKIVFVCWGTDYGSFWTMKSLLKNLSQKEDIEEQSSI